MISRWTQHIKDPEAKQRFANRILSCKDVFERLEDIILEKEQSLDRSEMNIESYDKPNWAYKQAHKNGLRAAFGTVKELINLDQKEQND